MPWNEGHDAHGHVIVALDGDYNDLTLDQFPGYDDWIAAEPVESGGQIAAFIQKVRDQGGPLTTRERIIRKANTTVVRNTVIFAINVNINGDGRHPSPARSGK
jgi:hypothetical protein